VGLADDVETEATALRSPKPASLFAATENTYIVPPAKPVTSIEVPVVLVVAVAASLVS
jgi:hypothetical protein